MKIIVDIDGEPRDVELKVEDGRATASVSGRTYELEVSEPEKGTFLFKHEGRVLEAGVTAGQDGSFDVMVNRTGFQAKVVDPKHLRGAGGAAGSDAGPAEIKTAMPGKVVRVLVSQGDEVHKGDGIIVVEAMKMQNELKAPKDGTIKEIRAEEGSTVAAGEVLVTVE